MPDPRPDAIYVAARRVLLDALEALEPHLDAVIVVGAQAIYLRTGDTDMVMAPYTADGDLALEPARVGEEPRLEQIMHNAGFLLSGGQPGAWTKAVEIDGRRIHIPVDLMVPDALAPEGGRRSARIPPHDKMATRRAVGLEAAVSTATSCRSRRWMTRIRGASTFGSREAQPCSSPSSTRSASGSGRGRRTGSPTRTPVTSIA